MALGILLSRVKEHSKARHIISVSEVNTEKYTEAEINAAIDVYHESYPLDFADYEEAPPIARSPYEVIRRIISPDLSNMELVFTKRWFELKILDELSDFEDYLYDSGRDSDLSKEIAAQLRGFMFAKAMSLGRMVEHYRWKFSYEADALKGIRTSEADSARGRSGGDTSAQAKRENILSLLDEIEKLGDLFPRIGEDAIFEQAYSNASATRRMPKTQKTIDEYGIIIRSEPEYKARYDAIFRKGA